jgi:hypothetical protein
LGEGLAKEALAVAAFLREPRTVGYAGMARQRKLADQFEFIAKTR